MFSCALLLTIVLLASGFVDCDLDEFATQPKILSHGGDIILQAVPDKNITFRLRHDASLTVNGVDVIAEVRKRLAAQKTKVEPKEPLSVDALTEQIAAAKQDINSLTKKTTGLQRRTRGRNARSRLLQRNLARIGRLDLKLAAIQTNLAIDECRAEPCKNGGTCYDGYLSFQCECAAGWEGATCEKDVNECVAFAGTDLAGCLNNGQCINTPGSYRCICRNGYTGAHCRLRKAVCITSDSTELCGHGTCIPANNEQGYVCYCDQGWTRANETAACTVDVDECEPSKNPCHAECINLPGSFKCGACPMGYTGDGKHCRDIDECTTNNGGCSLQPKVRCINTEGSHLCGRCPIGWTGDGRSCEQSGLRSCNGMQICHPRASCEIISDTTVCTCPLGMYGHGFGLDGCTVDASFDVCERHQCANNGTCIANGRGTSCVCQQGYMGPLCNQTDACHGNPCQNGAKCHLLPEHKYKCNCMRGYTGVHCEHLRFYCGAVLFNETGTLRFPPNGALYEPDERCAFILSTDRNKVLNVTFSAFDLEASADDCSKDFLQIHDGNALTAHLIGRFCGQTLPNGNGNFISTNKNLFFWFRSDNATQASGFTISWTSQSHVCGDERVLSETDSGVIRSPGYPGKLSPNRECEWTLEAPFGYRLLLHFYEITLGANNDACTGDIFTVQDSDRTLLQSCSSAQPPPVHSSSNQLSIRLHTDARRSDSAFQLHYEVAAGTPGCGGIYTEPRGTISGYMNAPVCLYLIQQPNDTRIEIQFTKFELLRSRNCNLQKLEVFDGRTAEAPLLRRLCGDQDLTDLTSIASSGNMLLLRYEYSLHGLPLTKTFEFTYKRTCGAELVSSGVVTTPGYPNAYYEHMTCTYFIRAPPSHVIEMNITDLSLSATIPNMPDNDWDERAATNSSLVDEISFLDVHIADDQVLHYIKSVTGISVLSDSNEATLVFHGAVNRDRKRGLRVEYTFQRIDCGGIIRSQRRSSFDFSDTSCEWIIYNPNASGIRLGSYFDSMDPKALLTIFDNGVEAKRQSPRSINEENFSTNRLKIVFTAGERSLNSLRVDVTFLYNETCGGVFSTSFGSIKSPNWPKPYGPDEGCIWLIEAPLGHKIELTVHNFSLETTNRLCTDDFLEIRNGDTPLSPLIGKYCGTEIPARIPSFGNRLYVDFHSDNFLQEAGFYLTWQQTKTGCGGKLTTHIGSIHSPHSITTGMRGAVSCDWQIYVAQGSTIKLSLNADKGDLCNGQLVIYDGPNTQSHALALNCTSTALTELLYSTGNQVLVRYNVPNSDDEIEGMPFVIDYETNCNVVLEKLHGVIETPNFPTEYPPNMNCLWDIRSGGRNNHISLVFSHLTVEHTMPTDCDYDYVELSDMKNEEVLSKRRLCTNVIERIVSEGNRLLVRFISDASTHANGFRAEYQRLGCGAHFYDNFGRFETPQKPYSVDMTCDWYIEAPFGKQIRLTFPELHIDTDQRDCSNDALVVSEEKSSSTVLLKSCQVAQMPQVLTSPGNRLYVNYRASNIRTRKYVMATYSFVEATCGGIQRGSGGLIVSPNYHTGEFANDVECLWSVEVPDGYGIELHFESFNMTESENCGESFVELVKINSHNEVFLEKACGSEQPLIRRVEGNKFSVKFKVSPKGWGRFALRYEQQCGGVLYTTEGLIKSRLDESCVWVLNSSPDSKISLDILHLECPCAVNASCKSGLKLFNEETDVLLFDICTQHISNLIMPTNSLKVFATNIELRLRYSSVQNSCGGNITSLSGVLTSPFYPDAYPANVECVWQLQAASGNAFELNFEMLDIAKSINCNGDFLEVRLDGEQGRLIGLYCSDEEPTEPLTAAGRVWIKFRSVQDSSGGRGFKLRWNYVHEHELNRTSGVIESPPVQGARFEPEPYSWRILAARGNVVELNVKEYNNGLQLFDGYDDTALTIDIKYSPWRFTSSSNVLYLKSDNNELEPFKLEWRSKSADASSVNTTNDTCYEEIKLSYEGHQFITSPGYPNGYADNLNCVWVLKPADTQHVIVDLHEVKLESTHDCWSDALIVSTSSDLLHWHEEKKLCDSGDTRLSPIDSIHGTPFAKLSFKTDASLNGTGFKALARTVCGANLTGTVGMILDSQLERWSTISRTCLWHIEVRPGRQVDIKIDYKGEALKQHDSCPHYGLIYDGFDDHAPLIEPGKFCNKEGFRTQSFRSTANHVVVKYLVPNFFGNKLLNFWNLTYREYSECHEEINLTAYAATVNISTPGYPYMPHPHTACSWIVIAPPGETITANFVDRFDLDLRNCNEEFVELYDGTTTLSRRLLHTCRKPKRTRSTGNVLYVRYQTDTPEPRSGFRLNVSISTCGAVFTDSNDFVASEHYPALGAYPKPAVCEYAIKLPKNTRIRINFTDLHLPYDSESGDNNDRLEFIDLETMTPVASFYGNSTTPPAIFESESNDLLLRFTTVSLSNAYRGFRLKYVRIYDVCYRDVSGVSGQITSKFLNSRSMFTYCRWRVTVPKGQRVRLRFLEIRMTSSFLNNTQRFKSVVRGSNRPTISLYNDDQSESLISDLTLFNNATSKVFKSTDNFMLVKVLLPRYANGFEQIKAEYTSEEDSPCPMDIGGTEAGRIDVSGLQGLTHFHCTISFTTKSEETISFSLAQYRTLKKNMNGAIAFRDQELQIPFLFLNQNITSDRVSLSARRGKITIVQNDNIKLLGLQASYRRHPCGGMLKLSEGLTLVKPSIEQVDYGELECVWTLKKNFGESDYALLGNVSFTESCDREYIHLYTGIRAYALQPTQLCLDTPLLNHTLLDKSYTTVVYRTANFNHSQGNFILKASHMLGSVVTKVTNNPSNPVVVDSNNYKNNMELYWEFVTNPRLYLSLIFKGRFFIEDSPNCANDSLEIQRRQDELWYTDARFCGRVVPPSYNISVNQIRVVFRTNEAVTGDGFSFVVASTCSISLNATKELQTLRSPKYETRTYFRNKCTYIFESVTDKLITVRVKYVLPGFPTAVPSQTCHLNSFSVYKQNKDDEEEVFVEKYCENFDISGYRRLRIDYESLLMRNFIIEYQLNDCGGNFSAPFDLRPLQGEELNTYAANMNCVWHISAPVEHAIIVRFKYFDMEPNQECLHDSVSIYKGAMQSLEQRVAHLCGNKTVEQPLIVIDSNQAVIVAVSDVSYARVGFLASVHFTPNCNERIALIELNAQTTLQRTFTVNSSEELLCFYKISAPPGHRISVDVKELQLNNSKGSCTGLRSMIGPCNFLEVLDGNFAGSTSLGKFFALTSRTGNRLSSSYEELVLKMSVNRPGNISFEVNLQMERPVCGETELQLKMNETIEIALPMDNSSTYAPNTHCTWSIATSNEVEIDFVSVRLPNSSPLTNKCVDYIRVSNSIDNQFFCGSFNNMQFIVRQYVANDKLIITFHSDNVVEEVGGFKLIISYRRLCNRTFTTLSQYHSTSNNDVGLECTFNFHVPDEYTLTLYLISIFMDTSANPYFDVIDLNANQTIFNTTTNQYETKGLLTSSNRLQIRISGVSFIHFFYFSTNKSLPRGCGGDIFSIEGRFSNPSYADHNHTECRWNIGVPGNEISLQIFDFNMGSLINCNLDNVKIFEVRSDGKEKLVNTFCGQNYIDPFKVNSSRIAVVATKTPNFDGEGFTINFSAISYEFSDSKDHQQFV